MRNKFTPLLICMLMALCPARSYGAEGAPDKVAGIPARGISASDEANITDLEDMEKGIQFLEDTAYMCFHSAVGNMKLSRNLLISITFGH